jgi:hypothetical protein
MAPLNRFLAGIILPHETFESHLNSKGETVDDQLERENVKKAGESLAEIWNEAITDDHSDFAEWRGGVVPESIDNPDHKWFASHVRASQYFYKLLSVKTKGAVLQ